MKKTLEDIEKEECIKRVSESVRRGSERFERLEEAKRLDHERYLKREKVEKSQIRPIIEFEFLKKIRDSVLPF